MKALTIHQPFASAIGHEQLDAPRKNYEIRPDPTKYRGPVLIHAGKRPPLNAYELNLGAVAVMGPGTPVRTYEEERDQLAPEADAAARGEGGGLARAAGPRLAARGSRRGDEGPEVRRRQPARREVADRSD
ncbi:MAG TPA: hypothetical protein P5144_12725 [Thermoanaerobaculia bacterium]|nr:hypothetical protein [Thermoanaerobaculia bacterium]